MCVYREYYIILLLPLLIIRETTSFLFSFVGLDWYHKQVRRMVKRNIFAVLIMTSSSYFIYTVVKNIVTYYMVIWSILVAFGGFF